MYYTNENAPSVVVTVVHYCYRSPEDMSDLE